jgi:hypothetical protein
MSDADLSPSDRPRPAPGDETAPPEGDRGGSPRATLNPPQESSQADQTATENSDPNAALNQGSVTIWEWVASLPPDQQEQYAEMLKQLEPQRAMMEAAIAAQRGQSPPATPATSRPAPGDETALTPDDDRREPGLLGKLFGRKKK